MTKSAGQQKAALFLVAILFFAGLLAFFSLQEGHDWGGDFALYFRQAGSLLNGTSGELLEANRFAMENSTFNPGSNPHIGPYLYPWGLPLLIAPVVAVFGYSLLPLKVYLIIYFLLSLWVCYRLFLPRTGSLKSLWVVALLGFNPFLLDFNNSINSDIPFLFFALLSLLFIEKVLGYRPYFVNWYTTYLLTGAFIFFSFLVRSNGILLVGVLGLGHLIKWYSQLLNSPFQFIKRNWQELLPYVVFVILWIIFGAILTDGSGSHLTFLKQIRPGKIYYNLMYYLQLPADFYEGIVFSMLLYGFSLPFFILGVVKRWRNPPDQLFLIYIFSSFFLFVLWPPIQGLRFIFSLLPFYLYYIFVGLGAAQEQLKVQKEGSPQHSWVSAFGIFVLVLFMNYNVQHIHEIHKNYPEKKLIQGPYTSAGQEVFKFIAENTGTKDVIVFFKPRVLSFFTGRQSLRVWKMNELRAGKGDFLLYYKYPQFGQLTEVEFLEIKKLATPVFENEEFTLVRLPESFKKGGN